MTGLPRPTICLVTSRAALRPDARTEVGALAALESWLDDAIGAGIDLIQIRERDLEARALCGLVARVVRRAEGSRVRVMVNDRADVAAVAGASGVHLRGDGPAVARVRGWLGPSVIIGKSTHSPRDTAAEPGADYLLFGTVFPSASKPAGAPVAGGEGLRVAIAAARSPVLAIGGVTPAHARECRLAGAAGIAAITPFLPPQCGPASLGPRAAIDAFRQQWIQDQDPRT